ncbi:MAG: phytanoyl-CoA dioxygenase [Alphaproteobacteria bacterium]|nr:MAG: phytanoyl-CoA dioxygenase [Alphaproteobacteria bacterium]
MVKASNVVPFPPADQDHLSILERDGFVVLENVLDERRCRRLAEELEPWLEATPRCEGDFYGWNTTRVGGLLSKAPSVHDLVMDPYILAIAEALLKPNCDCIQLNLTQAVRVHGQERPQAPHRDEEMWPWPTNGRHWLLNVMWAVSDFTEENGATRLWRGSHREALDRSIDPADSVPGAMKAGSALLFLGSLTHGAGQNQTALPRTGIIVSYCLGWLKTYENQFLAYPRDVAASFPEDLQRLIGYRIHRPNLGGWEGQDPIRYLSDDRKPRPHVDALTPEIQAQLKAHYGEDQSRGGDGA